MNKLPLVVALLLVLASSAFAQGSGYRVDNFDFAGALHVQVPAPVLRASRKSGKGRLVSATNYNYSPSNLSLTHPTSLTVGSSLGGYTTGNSAIDSFIVDSGRRHSVDPLLLYSIMHQESTFKPRAMSYKGARGLMQLMPGTAARFGVTSIWDPKQNIEGGTRYMRFLLNKFEGNVPLALAGYNAGEGAVMKYGNRVPPYNETQEYVRRISKRYSLIRDPLSAQYASNFTREQVAAVQSKDAAPLSMYERSVFAVRTPDGRLQLISQ
ncbi:MAG TPA: lytic transglycosylase domain-containing protein [Pyrinomonadaceae bacterium]|nr:lytic transglycosylase domain-containing protein [Pyrinomonadaceae bacterium]